jgi:TRAP-type C4-dicarboxylate transport system permease small subunit
MMNLPGKLLALVQRATIAVSVVLLLVMTWGMFAGVVMRYFVGGHVPYLETFLGVLLAWSVFLLIGSVARRDEHIRIGFFAETVLRQRAQPFFTALENIISLPLLIYLAWVGYRWVVFHMDQGTREFLGRSTTTYPVWPTITVVSIGCGIGALFYLERTVKQVRSLLLRRQKKQHGSSDPSEEREVLGDD